MKPQMSYEDCRAAVTKPSGSVCLLPEPTSTGKYGRQADGPDSTWRQVTQEQSRIGPVSGVSVIYLPSGVTQSDICDALVTRR